ncbi:MAG: hypothetical protein HYU76_02335 [Betaproteobacteria bacterium]|nr:hypothetical protein [Betaproteobacteria bacterium]
MRRAAPETLVVASGYSRREQIAPATSRRALHVAEVARLALSNRLGKWRMGNRKW